MDKEMYIPQKGFFLTKVSISCPYLSKKIKMTSIVGVVFSPCEMTFV